MHRRPRIRTWEFACCLVLLKVPFPLVGLAQELKLPDGWTAETKQIKVASPKGEELKQVRYYTNSIGMKFVLVPAGEFMMGGAPQEQGWQDNEAPQHKVRITSPFFMSAYEVTQEQYSEFMGDNPARFQDDSNNPVERVSWDDAVAFCAALGKKDGTICRLLTEAEWEYACRAGATTPFHFGPTISTKQANYDGTFAYPGGSKGENRQKTLPVGSFLPNAFGLYDMHGNVSEWCQDEYDGGYYAKSPPEDPKGGPPGEMQVVRGGSWFSKPDALRCGARQFAIESTRYAVLGFRVVVEMPK